MANLKTYPINKVSVDAEAALWVPGDSTKLANVIELFLGSNVTGAVVMNDGVGGANKLTMPFLANTPQPPLKFIPGTLRLSKGNALSGLLATATVSGYVTVLEE